MEACCGCFAREPSARIPRIRLLKHIVSPLWVSFRCVLCTILFIKTIFHNRFDDKVAAEFAGLIQEMGHGITTLNVSSTALTHKGLALLANALKQNQFTANSLRTLNTSNLNIGAVRACQDRFAL